MKKTFIYFLSFSFLLACVASKSTGDKQEVLLASQLHPVGRTAIDTVNGLELISSGSHFGFKFKGRQCSLFISVPDYLSHNYIQYTIDGRYMERIRISNKDSVPFILSADDNDEHEVVIYKATEAHTGPVYIEKIAADNIQSVVPASLPMIEFIGNSITCGAAADPSDIACGKGVYHDQHNAYLAYGPRVARALGTHFLLSSVSGIGIYRNWNSEGPAMPEVYENLHFRENDARWNFKTYKPSIVSIALGTNDFSGGDGKKQRLPFDSSRFVNEYVRFIQKVHSIYPDSKMVLLSSPMMQDSKRALLQNCLTAIRKRAEDEIGKNIGLYFFKPMKAGGCTGHPDVGDHEILAEELLPFFKKILNTDQ